VALGKFDAMHRGHAELARRASRMGSPILMSFGGMAEVLGWESKLPVVAPGDRARVLDAWKETCEGKTVREHVIPFADIRRMSPEEFVSTLKDIGVGGVVAGANYRFGFKAAGTADTLLELGETLGRGRLHRGPLTRERAGRRGRRISGGVREHAAGVIHAGPVVPRAG
jgi:FAD synthase